MAGHLRLQPLTAAPVGATVQRLDAVADVGDFGAVAAQIRVASPGGAGSVVTLQHAAALETDAFTDCAVFAVDVAGSQSRVLPPLLRYLRWRASVVTQEVAFQVDLIGREGSPGVVWRPLQATKTGGQGVTNAAGTVTLTWDADTSIAADGLWWDNAEEAIAVGRQGLLTLHYHVAAYDNGSWSAANDDGSSWSEIPHTRSFVWAIGGTHTATVQIAVPNVSYKFRVRVVNMTAAGTQWLCAVGAFWARWVE
jgi:hypothetical protein